MQHLGWLPGQQLDNQPAAAFTAKQAGGSEAAGMDTSSSLKAASDYDDDGIYVLSEDELDGQTVLDLQLELSIIKKRLRSTELAYRALEDEYVSIKSSNSICIACIADLEFAHKQYPNTFLGGTSAGQDCIRLLRQHVDELGEDLAGPAARILVAWVPPAIYSRDFKDGFAGCNDTLLVETGGQNTLQTLLSTLLPLPQLKKVYTTLAPGMTSSLLLPHIKQALDAAHDCSSNNGNSNGHLSNTSPFMRHRRSFTSASSLSTMSRCSGNGDSLLSKFILLQPGQTDKRSVQAINEIKNEICKAYAGNEAISKDLAETDFETLFPRLDFPDLWIMQPAEKEVVQAPVEIQPVEKTDTQPIEKAAAPPVVEKENMWAEIVRKGRSKETPAPAAATVIPSTPNAKIAHAPSSPTTSTSTPSGPKNEPSASPSRNRRSRGGGARKKDDTATGKAFSQIRIHSNPADQEGALALLGGSTQVTELDPTVSLCRQKPPPCNQHYLTAKGCSNPKCNYSHAYKLLPDHLEEMRQGAAKTACVYRKNGQVCASGDECVFGHKCPQGARCKQNKCHFPTSMH